MNLYGAYLKSEAWQELKARKREECPEICAACGFDDHIHLHHMTYREPITLGDLVWLCHGCHYTFHMRAGLTLPKKYSDDQLLQKTLEVIRGTLVIEKQKRANIAKLNKMRKKLAEAAKRQKMGGKWVDPHMPVLSSFTGITFHKAAA